MFIDQCTNHVETALVRNGYVPVVENLRFLKATLLYRTYGNMHFHTRNTHFFPSKQTLLIRRVGLAAWFGKWLVHQKMVVQHLFESKHSRIQVCMHIDMSMQECMSACIHACMLCVYVYIYINTQACMYSINACMYTYSLYTCLFRITYVGTD